MKEQDVADALNNAHHWANKSVMPTSLDRCGVAEVVYNFLTSLIERGNWIQRQVLRTVRGWVKSYMIKNC